MKHSASMDDLPFRSISPSVIFPGRISLYLWEVAEVFPCHVNHVRDLIEEGKLGAIDISGNKVAIGRHCAAARRFWRVPVSEYEKFIQDNRSI
jgi:hypothetical protein